jgi:acyl-CoA thioester hydrolase
MTDASPPAPDLKSRASFDFFTSESLRIADLDLNGHVNNLTFLQLFENARNRFLQERTPLVRDETRTYMLVHLDIDFAAEMHWPGTPEAACRVIEVRRSSLVFGQAVFVGDKATATGHAAIVNVDRRLRKASPFDEETRAKLAALLPQSAS